MVGDDLACSVGSPVDLDVEKFRTAVVWVILEIFVDVAQCDIEIKSQDFDSPIHSFTLGRAVALVAVDWLKMIVDEVEVLVSPHQSVNPPWLDK